MSFENFVSQGPLTISSSRAKDIFENVIVPRFGVQGDPVENPTYVIIGGQPGSGKSTSIRQAQTGLQGATQKIIPDEALTWLPGYNEMAAIDPHQAFNSALEANSSAFATELEERAKARRANVVVECPTPLGSEQFNEYYREDGYRAELHVIATPFSLSWTSTLDRTERALEDGGLGSNTVIGLNDHEIAYANWPRAVFDAEDQKQYDRVVIKNRNGEVLYENELVLDGGELQWKKSPRALEALLAGRNRPFTPREVETTQDTWKRLIASKHRPLYNDCALPMSLESCEAAIMSDVQREGRLVEPSSATVMDLTELVRQDVGFCLSESNRSYGSSPAFERRMENYTNDISAEAEKYNSDRTGDVLPSRLVSSFRRISSSTADFLKTPLGADRNSQRKPAAKSPSLETIQEEDEKGRTAKGTPRLSATTLGKSDLNAPLPPLPVAGAAGSTNLSKRLLPLPKSPMLADTENERIGVARDIRRLTSEIESLQGRLAETQQCLHDISQMRQALHQGAEQYQHSSIAEYDPSCREALEHGKKSISSNEQNTRAALKMPRTFDASRRPSGGHDR